MEINELTNGFGEEEDAGSGEDDFDPVFTNTDFKGPLLGTASDCCSSELALCQPFTREYTSSIVYREVMLILLTIQW